MSQPKVHDPCGVCKSCPKCTSCGHPTAEPTPYYTGVKPKRVISEEMRKSMSERAKTSRWNVHLAQFRKDHPELKGKECMRAASACYEKQPTPEPKPEPEPSQ